MLLRPPTEAELRHTFNEVLDGIVSGRLTGCPADTGLDQQTEDILNLLARPPGGKRRSDIATCRIEFEQLTLGELEDFFIGAWPLLRVLEMNLGTDTEQMLDLFEAVSQFYPDHDRLLRQRVIEALSRIRR